jgi:UDP-glucose 4-epimerase
LKYSATGSDPGATVRFIAETVIATASPDTRIRYTGGQKGQVGGVPRYTYSTLRLSALGWNSSMTSEQAVDQAVREIYDSVCRQ